MLHEVLPPATQGIWGLRWWQGCILAGAGVSLLVFVGWMNANQPETLQFRNKSRKLGARKGRKYKRKRRALSPEETLARTTLEYLELKEWIGEMEEMLTCARGEAIDQFSVEGRNEPKQLPAEAEEEEEATLEACEERLLELVLRYVESGRQRLESQQAKDPRRKRLEDKLLLFREDRDRYEITFDCLNAFQRSRFMKQANCSDSITTNEKTPSSSPN